MKKVGHLAELGREGVQRACLDLLAAERIRFFRMNAGDTFGVGSNGKRWRKRGHQAGTADTLILLRMWTDVEVGKVAITRPVWLEFKSTDGEQNPDQAQFQSDAEKNGELYLIIRDPSELQRWLKEHRA